MSDEDGRKVTGVTGIVLAKKLLSYERYMQLYLHLNMYVQYYNYTTYMYM